jgi:hypothetical protein
LPVLGRFNLTESHSLRQFFFLKSKTWAEIYVRLCPLNVQHHSDPLLFASRLVSVIAAAKMFMVVPIEACRISSL